MGLVESPTMIVAAGNLPKQIAEYVGHLNTKKVHRDISEIACWRWAKKQTTQFKLKREGD